MVKSDTLSTVWKRIRNCYEYERHTNQVFEKLYAAVDEEPTTRWRPISEIFLALSLYWNQTPLYHSIYFVLFLISMIQQFPSLHNELRTFQKLFN